MTLTRWILVACCVIGGFVIGTIAAGVLRRVLGKTPNDSVKALAPQIARSTAALCGLVGLVAAAGVISPDSLEPIPGDLVRFLPSLIIAMVFVIGGRIASEIVGSLVERIAMRSVGAAARRLGRAVGSVILALCVLLAVRTLGIDTTLLNILVAALAFGAALAVALLIGLGGRDTATQLAAGRSLRKLIETNDHVVIDGAAGTVTDIEPTHLVVQLDGGRRLLIPHHRAASQVIEVTRPDNTTSN
jgi:hypothetical protein